MLEDKVLEYISQHPEGVHVLEMEDQFGQSRMRLGYIIIKLLEEGKIEKKYNTYVVKSNNQQNTII